MRVLMIATALTLLGAGAASAQYTPYKPPTYTAPTYKPAPAPQAPYQNYGQISSSTNKPMTDTVSGYVRKDGTYVNPYARSK